MPKYRIHLDYQITWQSGWHVGSGFGTAAVDRLIRTRNRSQGGKPVPYVPGSQIKGVVRNRCEQLVCMLESEVVDPHGQDRDNLKKLAQAFGPLRSSDLIVDRLFGTRFDGDRLFFADALPELTLPKSRIRRSIPTVSQTTIDRTTGTVANQKLFSSQRVPANWMQLSGTMEGIHRDGEVTRSETTNGFPYEYALLVLALSRTDMLGGQKTSGLGSVEILISGIKWRSAVERKWQIISVEQAIEPLTEDDDVATLMQMQREEQIADGGDAG